MIAWPRHITPWRPVNHCPSATYFSSRALDSLVGSGSTALPVHQAGGCLTERIVLRESGAHNI